MLSVKAAIEIAGKKPRVPAHSPRPFLSTWSRFLVFLWRALPSSPPMRHAPVGERRVSRRQVDE